MRVLLIGEYSGVYTGLVKLFQKNNIETFWIHGGDGFKNFAGEDYRLEYKHCSSKYKILNRLFKSYYNVSDFLGLKGLRQIRQHYDIFDSLKDFDAVLLINTKFLTGFSSFANLIIFNKLKKNNKNIYLSALGDDYIWVKNCLEGKVPFSMFDRMNWKNFLEFRWALLYIYGFGAKRLNNVILSNVKTIIPGLYDYYHAYKSQNIRCTEVIPVLIPTINNRQLINPNYPLIIFHGWQPGKELRKGNDIFHNAIIKLQQNYPNKVKYEVIGGMSYDEYVKSFDHAQIFIDQCFSLDSGVNGLLGMSKGKVVLTGMHSMFREYLNLPNHFVPCITAQPNEDYLYSKLEELILDLNQIKNISNQAVEFVNKYHDEDDIFNSYIDLFKNYNE